MRFLPLYPRLEPSIIETTEPLTVDHSCVRCPAHAKARSVCLSAEGEPGGVLLVGEAPGKTEDNVGRPFCGASGDFLRSEVSKHWSGPVAYDNGVRCLPPKKLDPKLLRSCRGYLAKTIKDAQPSRIIALGANAARSILGRSVPPFSCRKAFSFLSAGTLVPNPVPVFMCIHPTAALRNRFVRSWLVEDLKWALTTNVPFPLWDAEAQVIETEEDSIKAVRVLRSGIPSFDVETAGRMWDPSFRILCLSACNVGSDAPYLWTQRALSDNRIRSHLLEYLADPKAPKGGQNVKYDVESVVSAYGVLTKGIAFDTRLERKLLDAEADAHLDVMAELVGMGGHKEAMHREQVAVVDRVRNILKMEAKDSKKGKATRYDLVTSVSDDPDADPDPTLEAHIRSEADSETWSFAMVNPDTLHRYNARDTLTTSLLQEHLEKGLNAEPSLRRMWDLIVRDAGVTASRIEIWGLPLDVHHLKTTDNMLAIKESSTAAQLKGFADINWGSPVQVADFLFGKCGLIPPKMTETGKASTDKGVLEQLDGKHPSVAVLREYRQLSKLRSTYTGDGGLPSYIRADGRIHGSLDMAGATTGRTSFSDPNLQNIPVRTDFGKMIRNAFQAPPGTVFIQWDYSQIELRVAAMLSGDPLMIDLFKSGADFHQATAEMICEVAWGITRDKLTKDHRRYAKDVNFGTLYGQGAPALSKKMGCSKAQAARIQEAILGKFKKLAQWCQDQTTYARKHGEVWTWWAGQRARRRPMWAILDQDEPKRITAENGSFNTPVQGTANEFAVASMIEVVKWIDADAVPAKLVLPIHDSIMLEVREDAVNEVIPAVTEIMTQWDSQGVPIKVDVEMGKMWGSLEKVAA